MSIFDYVYLRIKDIAFRTGNYPNRIILGADVYNKLSVEVRELGVIVLTPYSNERGVTFCDVPVTIDYSARDIIEIGCLEHIRVGADDGSK
jgi:hypothetical protein